MFAKVARSKTTAGFTSLAIASLAVFGGSYAMYTDRTTAGPQKLQAGTVKIALHNGVIDPFTVPVAPLAAGDTFTRYVDLENTGNLGLTRLTLSQTNNGSPLFTDANGVLASVETCAVPWHEGNCDGTHYDNIASQKISDWDDWKLLGLPELAPGGLWYLKFTTHLPMAAANTLQNEQGAVQYTFNGIQPGESNGEPPVAPMPVPQLSATALGQTAIDVNWTKPTGITSVTLQRSLTAAFSNPEDILINSTATAYRDETVEPSTTYYYRAIAHDSGTRTSTSSIASATTTAATLAWAQISATATGHNLAWTPVAGATTYVITTGSTSGSYPIELYRGTSTSFTAPLGTPGSYFYYKVQALKANNTAAADSPTEARLATPMEGVLSMESMVLTASSTAATLKTTRNDVIGANTYELSYRPTNGQWTSQDYSTKNATNTLTPNTAYEVKASATALTGETMHMAAIEVEPAIVDYNLNATPGVSENTLTWNALPAGYEGELLISSNSSMADPQRIDTAGITSYTDTTAEIGMEKFYRLEVTYHPSSILTVHAKGNIATATAHAAIVADAPSVTTVSYNTQTLQWQVPSNAGSARLTRSKLTNGSYDSETTIWEGNAGVHSQSWNTLDPNATYRYTLILYRGVNQTGTSYVAQATGLTFNFPGVLTPEVQTSATAPQRFTVAEAPSSVFKLQRSSDSNFGLDVVDIGSYASDVTALEDGTIAPSTTYYYRLITSNSSSPVITVTTLDAPADLPLVKPSNVIVEEATPTSYAINWTAPAPADGVEIYRTNDAAENWQLMANVPKASSTSWTDPAPGPAPAYAVVSYKASNVSGEPGSAGSSIVTPYPLSSASGVAAPYTAAITSVRNVASDDRYYYTTSGFGLLWKTNRSTGITSQIFTSQVLPSSYGFLRAQDGFLYTLGYNVSGEYIYKTNPLTGATTKFNTSFKSATRIIEAGDGSFYIMLSGLKTIYKWDPVTDKSVLFKTFGSTENAPNAGIVASDGTLYTVNSNAAYRTDPITKVSTKLPAFTGAAAAFSGTYLHVTLGVDGMLYVSNGFSAATGIYRVNPTTGVVTLVKATGADPVIVADTNGKFLVAEIGISRVSSLDPTSAAFTMLYEDTRPAAMAYGLDNRIYVVTVNGGKLQRLDELTGKETIIATGFTGVTGMTYGLDNMIYITVSASNTIYRVDPTTGATSTVATVTTPASIAYGNDNMLYVISNSTLYKVNPSDGAASVMFSGLSVSRVNFNAMVTSNGKGTIYLTETTGFSRIDVATGIKTKQTGSGGDSYVAEAGTHLVTGQAAQAASMRFTTMAGGFMANIPVTTKHTVMAVGSDGYIYCMEAGSYTKIAI